MSEYMARRICPEMPGEIYEDKHGERWVVLSLCFEPTVRMARIDALGDDRMTQFGGVSGLIWDGFKKVLDAPKR